MVAGRAEQRLKARDLPGMVRTGKGDVALETLLFEEGMAFKMGGLEAGGPLRDPLRVLPLNAGGFRECEVLGERLSGSTWEWLLGVGEGAIACGGSASFSGVLD